MKKLLLPLLIASSLAVTACCDCKPNKNKANAAGAHSDEHSHEHNHENGDEHNHEHNHENGDEHDHSHEHGDMAKTATSTTALALGDFDWNAKASSTSSVDIGTSPYITLPEGMMLVKGADASTEQNATNVIKNGNLNIYDGEKVSSNQGVLSYLDITGKEGADFEKTKFDSYITDHMKSIGAVEFYNDIVPNDLAKQIDDLDGISNEDYMSGAFSDRKLRQFAVNHEKGQLFYQVMSDDTHGEIGVLEVKGFKAIDFAPVAPSTSTEESTEADEKAKAEADEKAKAQPTAAGMKEQLSNDGKAILNINFESAKVSIRKDNMPIIDQIYTLLKDNPELKIRIEGHTDSSGKAEMNQKLSVWRAKEVKAALEKKGIDASRLQSTGFGKDKPIADNDTEENRAKNRRVELVQFK